METGLISRVCDFVQKTGSWGELCETAAPGLSVYACQTPTETQCQIYETVLCLILQGTKEAFVGDRKIVYGQGASVLASHDLHIRARVMHASEDVPYVALVLSVDIELLRSIQNELAGEEIAERYASSFEVTQADPTLIDAMDRYFGLAENPDDARVLGPLIKKEIHYRLLTAPNGAMLESLLKRDSHASRIADAIGMIRENFAMSISVSKLASNVGMSESSFHQHFKTITATTPLQYQKDLRLIEARRLLLDRTRSVSEAAYEVGYESATQFSREYSRKFGISPSRDQL